MNETYQQEKILVFPGGMPRSLEFLNRSKLEKRVVLGASSLGYDPASTAYDDWAFLPYVVSSEFDACLVEVVKRKNVTAVFTPNLVVWDYLKANLGRLCPGVVLLNSSPVEAELESYKSALLRAKRVLGDSSEIATSFPTQPRLSLNELAGTYRLVDTVPGMCDYDKMDAIAETMRSIPPGDVVEIGSWWGKSAALLAILSRRYQIGSLLCVDPWADEKLLQPASSNLVDMTATKISATQALAIFEMNLAPIASGHVNYLRLASAEASTRYRKSTKVSSSCFGDTVYSGGISLLHIDGNHDYAAVETDINSWMGLLLPGAVVVFDDYVWPYGDGPQRAADHFVKTNEVRLECAYAMGSALFVKLRSSTDGAQLAW